MNESFKFNIFFDENGEELEKLISSILIDTLSLEEINYIFT